LRAYIMITERATKEEEPFLSRQIRNLGFINSFDVLGPYDVIVEVEAKDNNDLFYNIIRPIIGLAGVSGCTTHVTVSPSEVKPLTKRTFAYVLVQAMPQETQRIQNELFQLDEIRKVDAVLGPYDIIADVTTDSLSKLVDIVSKIRRILGILRTTTLITFTPT